MTMTTTPAPPPTGTVIANTYRGPTRCQALKFNDNNPARNASLHFIAQRKREYGETESLSYGYTAKWQDQNANQLLTTECIPSQA